jgi:hypothetical protein
LHEHVDELRKAPLRWLGAFVEDRLLGALAGSRNNDELDIEWVANTHAPIGSSAQIWRIDRGGDRELYAQYDPKTNTWSRTR